ncbi:MAG: hypothetical protein JSW59_12000 [Phycisphaerales bacterium]|nr:MAG: hypothetical protein JSW59_12000 [Phycisphaerales bacterium]
MFTQIAKSRSVNSLAVVVLVLGLSVCLAQSKGRKPALGELRLDGEDIERLVLLRNDGRRQVLTDPEEVVKLPVGQYLLKDVHLKGGYTSRIMPGVDRNRVTIAQDKPESLKVGAPLKQSISIQRSGTFLELTYCLRGVGGNTYRHALTGGRPSRPSFTIYKYKGAREIATGKFEFG